MSGELATDAFEVGQIVAERYRVLRRLGEGAMGAVYVVEHIITRHQRALKTLHGSLCATASVVARFLNEASAAGRIGNPHIVETIDAGRLTDGSPYLVMELLQGQPLEVLLASKGKLEPVQAAEIVAQACAGIYAAHQKNIIHRDLKPANLFVVAGAIPFTKVLDFGVSRFAQTGAVEHRLTKLGEMVGTPYYMAPEQARAEIDIDARADVYALGVVLYECLTGTIPFDGKSYLDLLTRIVSGQHVPVEVLRPEVPAPLCAVVRRAMAVEKDARYATARQLEEALRSLPLEGMSLVDPSFAPAHGSGYPKSQPPTQASVGTDSVLAGSTLPPTEQQQATDLREVLGSTESPLSRSVSQDDALRESFAKHNRLKRVAIGITIAATIGIAAAGSLAWRHFHWDGRPSDTPTAAQSIGNNAASLGTQTVESVSRAAMTTTNPSVVAQNPALTSLASSAPSTTPSIELHKQTSLLRATAPHLASPSTSAVHPTLPAAAPATPTESPKSRAEQIGLKQKNPFATPGSP